MEKIKNGIKNLTCTQAALAEAFGLSKMRVNQLIEEEIVIPDETDKGGGVFLFDSVKNYYQSKNISDGVNYWKEKGLNERAKRQLNELKVEQAAGELYYAADVEASILEVLTVLKNNLLGMPSKLAKQLENTDREEIYLTLAAEIEDILKDISEFKYEVKS